MIVDQKTFQCRKVRKLGKRGSSTRGLCNEAPHWGCDREAGQLHLFFTKYGLFMHMRRMHVVKRPAIRQVRQR